MVFMLGVFVRKQTESSMLSQKIARYMELLKDVFLWMRFLKFSFIVVLLFRCFIAVPQTTKSIDYNVV